MPGFWKRPIGRVYSYNLDLGESYYSPMSDYVRSTGRTVRDESPGPLTYSERLSRKWLEGDKDRQWRARTEAREYGHPPSAGFRAGSEVRTTVATPSLGLPPLPSRSRRGWRETVMQEHERAADVEASVRQSSKEAEAVFNAHRRNIADSFESSYKRTFESSGRAEDDVFKRMADIRMSPWRGSEIEEEFRMAQQSRTRMASLEKELDDVTRSAMKYRPYYGKSARQMALEAAAEEERSTCTRRTRQMTVDSTRQYY